MKDRKRKRLINLMAAGSVTLLVIALAIGVSAFNYQDALSQREAQLETLEATATWSAYAQALQEAEVLQMQQQLDAQSTQLDQLEGALDALVTRESLFIDQVDQANGQILTLDEENLVLRSRIDELDTTIQLLVTREAEFIQQIELINSGDGD